MTTPVANGREGNGGPLFMGPCDMGKRPADDTADTQSGPSTDRSTGAARAGHTNIIETWVDEHGDYLFGYALPRVRDGHLAEELVQETFLAAVKAVGSFRGDSSPRTWLVGLLRRKIADHYRKRSREQQTESMDTADPTIEAWFDEKGAWIKLPARCEIDPAELAERGDFWMVFEECLRALPERLAEAFSLRVMDDRAPEEVCKILSITATNLWVALHRARARLRACLEANWFGTDEAEQG